MYVLSISIARVSQHKMNSSLSDNTEERNTDRDPLFSHTAKLGSSITG